MTAGKMAAQAGHAFLSSWLDASSRSLSSASVYASELPGTKVCLAARSLPELMRALDRAKELSIPHALIVDSGCKDFFDGRPIVTALGLGPSRKHEIKTITGRFSLWRQSHEE